MISNQIKNLIHKAIQDVQKQGILPDFSIPEIEIITPPSNIKGDFSTNISAKIAKTIHKTPDEVAKILIESISAQDTAKLLFKAAPQFVKPVFINFFLSNKAYINDLKEIIKKGENYGSLDIGLGQKVQIEFLSANPTGPLTIGNGRGAFVGDCLANIFSLAGYQVEREYYVNDMGSQIEKLGHSVLGDDQAVYRGEYIKDIVKKINKDQTQDVFKIGQQAAQLILKEIIKPVIEKKLKIKFDRWFLESSLYRSGEIDKVIQKLKAKNLLYRKDQALWFKGTEFGLEKDCVLEKKNGYKTYLAGDLAYHVNKFKRGFDKVINIWGADHFGDVPRLFAGLKALNYSEEKLKIILVQFVRLIKKGREMRISKRRGNYITLEKLIDSIGLDISRFFFLMRAVNTHMNFDLDLAKEESEKNPVYYIQYAYARIAGILKKAKIDFNLENFSEIDFNLLKQPAEINLIKKLIIFPEIIEKTTKDFQVQRLPHYAFELASSFHKFYENCQVISSDKVLSRSRLALIESTRIILKKTLSLMGISSPEKM